MRPTMGQEESRVSGGSEAIGRRRARARTALAVSLSALLASLAALAPSAAASETRPFEGEFCEPSGLGTAPCQPSFLAPEGLAVVPEGLAGEGDLLAIDAKPETEVQKVNFSGFEEHDTFTLGDLPPSCSASTTEPIEYVAGNDAQLGDRVNEKLQEKCDGNINAEKNQGGAGVQVIFRGELLDLPQALLSCATVAGGGSCSPVNRSRAGHLQALARYNPDGTPAGFSALGTNAIDGRRGPGLKPCGEEAASCDETPGNGGVIGQFYDAKEVQVAVAPPGAAGGTEGDIYLTDSGHYLVDVFAPDGRYLGQLTKYKQGPTAEGPAEPSFGEACGVAVDSAGAVYVADFSGQIHKYLPSANPPVAADNVANFAAVPENCALAAGAGPSAGSLFVLRWFEEAFDEEDKGQLYKLDAATGALAYGGEPVSEGNTTVSVDPASGYALAANGAEAQEWDAADAAKPSKPAVETPAENTVEGLAAEPGGNLYLSRSVFANVEVYGPLVTPPGVVTLPASNLGETGATLNGTVDPKGTAVEECAFEWGEHRNYGHTAPCAESATQIGEGEGPVAVHADLSGLSPGRFHHFRLSARNAQGSGVGEDETFAASGGEAPACANQSLRSGPSASLPDCRAYERVSPPDKNNAEIGVPATFAGGSYTPFGVAPQQASPDGGAATYHSFTSFGEEAQSAPGTSQYISRRGAGGWATENPNPPFEEGYVRDPFAGFAPSLGASAVIAYQTTGRPPLGAPPPPEGVFNLFARDSSGALRTITAEAPQVAPEVRYCIAFQGASAGFDRLAFAARGALRPGDPVPAGAFNLYEWTPGAGLELASALPGGSAAPPAVGTSFGASNWPLSFCEMSKHLVRHAVSADGRRMFWTYGGGYEGAEKPLFARVLEGGGAQTIQLDKPNQGVAGAGGGGHYWDATPDGSRVFFTDSQKLTADGHGGDLYMYDFDRPAGERLADLTAGPAGAGVQGVVGTSEDGRFAYFAATAKLEGAEASPRGAQPQAGHPNLYAWHEAGAGGELRFVATLGGGEADSNDWTSLPEKQTARVSPNGRYLAFRSKEALTGFQNTVAGHPACDLEPGDEPYEFTGGTRCPEVFLYDFEGRELNCASCNPSDPSGEAHRAPIGPALLPSWSAPFSQPRYLLGDGRLFFESFDSLSPRDTNGMRDVYEYEQPGTGSCTAQSPQFDRASGGCAFLLSSGESADNSYFLDASTDGRDAFLSSRQELAPADADRLFDVYDARVGGGFAYEPPEVCKGGEECRGQDASAAPPSLTAATAAFQGAGNPTPRKGCPKGRRRIRRHGRTRCVKRHRHRRHRHRHRKHRRGPSHRKGRASR
jgi:hypothetical protein